MPRRSSAAKRRAPAAARAKRPSRPARSRTRKAAVAIDVPPGWVVARSGKQIEVQVKTRDFLEALDVIVEIGRVAEALEHHPDLHIERYNHLRIVTYSHDVGKLTERDERLAARITQLLEKRGLTGA